MLTRTWQRLAILIGGILLAFAFLQRPVGRRPISPSTTQGAIIDDQADPEVLLQGDMQEKEPGRIVKDENYPGTDAVLELSIQSSRDGPGISGLSVAATNGGLHLLPRTTDQNGLAVILVEAEKPLALLISGSRFGEVNYPVDPLLAGEVRRLALVLDDNQVFTGRVLEKTAMVALPGAQIYFIENAKGGACSAGSMHELCRADSTGYFVVLREPNSLLVVTMEGFSPLMFSQSAEDVGAVVDLPLERASELKVVATGWGGMMRGALVHVEVDVLDQMLVPTIQGQSRSSCWDGELGPDLDFVISQFPANARSRIELRSSSGLVRRVAPPVPPGESLIVEFALEYSGIIGRAVRDDGAPAGDIDIWIQGIGTGDAREEKLFAPSEESSVKFSATTDRDGLFEVGGIEAVGESMWIGPSPLQEHCIPLARRFSYGEVGNVVVVVSQGVSVTGHVVDPAGVVAGGASIAGSQKGRRIMTKSAIDGTFALNGLLPYEDVSLVAIPSNVEWASSEVVVCPAPQSDLRLALRNGFVLAGKVENIHEAGKVTVVAAPLLSTKGDPPFYVRSVGISGDFAFAGMPIGKYLVFARQDGVPSLVSNVVVATGEGLIDLVLGDGGELTFDAALHVGHYEVETRMEGALLSLVRIDVNAPTCQIVMPEGVYEIEIFSRGSSGIRSLLKKDTIALLRGAVLRVCMPPHDSQ